MKHILSALLLSAAATAGIAQDAITFENENHKSVSTYDQWESSPFRTGLLEGQVKIIDNSFIEEGINESSQILAFNRSRYGSHLYGARVDLKTPVRLSPTPSYVHVMTRSPRKGSVAVVGLGKRYDWQDQSAETFQLARVSTKEIPAGKWADAVFKLSGNEAAEIHSLVIIPDTESMLYSDSDYVVYFDEIVFNNDANPRFSAESYPISFEKTAERSRTDRHINGITFTGNQGAQLSISSLNNSKLVYFDKTEEQAISVVAGETITPAFDYTGNAMHRYVYFDKGNDGKFTPEIQNNRPTDNSDLLSYSYLNGYNSNGESGTTSNPPAFTIPQGLEPGFYRIRCKIDWDSDNAAGNPSQSIIDNGGAIVDFLANVHNENVAFSVNARMCTATAIDGSALPEEIPFGEDFTFKVEMSSDYVIKGLKIKHGYNLTGEQYINDNRQWKEETLSLSQDGEVTIPAEYIDGNMAVEILYANKPTGYPAMQRIYKANNQENRYLREVVATVNGKVQTIFTATTPKELPYTQYTFNTAWEKQDGALIDKTAVPVTVPKGTTSFKMTFKPYTGTINNLSSQLVWTSQAYYIDANNDFLFSGSNEIYPAVGTPATGNNFGDASGNATNGWTRDITIPVLPEGTYRMRVVYLEPGNANGENYGSDWNEKLFTTHNGVIKAGIAYDFDINIVEAPVEYTEPTFTADNNKPFNDTKFKDTYVESITLTNGEQEKSKTYTAKPENHWNVLSDMEMTAKVGETINAHFVAYNLGAYNTNQVLQDLRFTAVVLAIDWNGDGTFEYTQKIKGNTPPTNVVGGNAKPEEGDGYVMDYTYAITVPETAVAGKKARVRFNYTNAWFNNKPATDFIYTCKEGIVYDFDIAIEEPAPAGRMVTVESADETMGTVAITSPSGTTGNSVNTVDDVTVQATVKSGYTFVNWTNKDGGAVVSTENPYTYTEAEDITLVANFQAVITGWTVNWTNPEHATIEIELTNGTKISNGGTVPYDSEVYIIPTPAPGYRISKVIANGVNVSAKLEEGKLVYKTTIRANTEFSVTTSEVIYRIDWDEATFTNGSFQIFNTNDLSTAIVKNSVINIGDKFKVVPVPNDNYMVSRVYYKYFPNPTDDDIVDITESADGYTFTATPNTNPSKNIIYVYADFIEKPAVINRYAQTTKKSNISKDSYVERLEVNDKILGEWSSFNDDSRSNQITLAAWVNFESSSYYADGMAIMGHYQGHYVGNGTTPSFTVSASSNGKMGIFSRTRNDSGGYPGTSSSTINEIDIPQGWFHLALTAKLDGSNIVYKLYVNGEETSASKTVPGNENSNLPYLPDNTDGLGCVLSFGGDMNCKFDDIMIWTEAISPEEVKEAMKGYTDAELASMTTLVGYYTCDDMLENQGTSKNLGSNKTYDLKLQNLKIKALNPPTTGQKEPISEANLATYIQDSERDVPRGGEKLFESDEDATWLTNGDEDFGYIVKSDNTKRLAYDGFRKVALADNVLAVYHNGDAELPTYVKEEDLESMTGAKTEMTSSYVVAGLDYTVQMPAVAKQWMPISMPAEVDLITVENGNGVRPGKNFWYAEPVVTGKNVTWTDITDEGNTDGTSYLNNLNPGIISVPELRVDQHFTFFTALGTPVVMRAYNQAYAAAQMPQAGVLKFVANPYATTVRAAQLTGEAANMTIYRMNTASGNFDPVEGTVTLKEFEPVFVFNNGGNPSMAPRYIGTKDVSGVLEAEAVYNVNVRGTKGAIEVEAFVPADIEIFTVNGVKVAAEKVEGTRAFNLLSGIYVVRTVADGNAETIKVVVE